MKTLSLRPPLCVCRVLWMNVSYAVNYRWTFRQIIDIAIDLFTSKDRYFLCHHSGGSVYNPDNVWERAFAYLYGSVTLAIPLSAKAATRIGSSLLDNSMLLLFHEPYYVFNNCIFNSPTCFAGTNSIAVDLINMKDRFFSQHPPQAIRHFSNSCDPMWLHNDHSTGSRKYVA